MNNVEFASWLEDIQHKFKSLTCEQKNTLLDGLIEKCPSAQLHHLSQQLEDLLKRDFLQLLPQEIVQYILNNLSPETLLTCCAVSKTWNRLISGSGSIWQKACSSAGVNSRHIRTQDSRYLKRLYLLTCKKRHALLNGNAFSTKFLQGHHGRVTAVYYCDGKLATGSDDHTVRLWDCESGMCLAVVHTHTLTAIKFTDDFLATASCDRTAATWDINSGTCKQTFIGHVAAVFCVEYDLELNILVTGSADSTLRVWNLNTGDVLQSLTEHRCSWILNVHLYHNAASDHYFLLSRGSTSIHMWKMSGKHQAEMMERWYDSKDQPLIPGMILRGSNVIYGYMASASNGTLHITTRNLDHYDRSSTVGISLQTPVSHESSYHLMGSGQHYGVILNTAKDDPVLDVFHNSSSTVLASIPVDSSQTPSVRGGTIALGDQCWLDGFCDKQEKGMVFTSVLRDNTIFLMKWTNKDEMNEV